MDKVLLSLLVCPQCKGSIQLLQDNSGLSCAACACIYPIKEDIPVLLKEEAVAEKDWNKKKEKGVQGS